MVKQKMSAWLRGKKRSRIQKKLDISEKQADELLSIMSLRPLLRKRLKPEDTQALQQMLSKAKFEPAAFESLVETRLQKIKFLLEARTQAFAAFANDLDQSQRIALSEMMASCKRGRHRHFCA